MSEPHPTPARKTHGQQVHQVLTPAHSWSDRPESGDFTRIPWVRRSRKMDCVMQLVSEMSWDLTGTHLKTHSMCHSTDGISSQLCGLISILKNKTPNFQLRRFC